MVMSRAIRQGLDACAAILPDVLPDEVRREHQLCRIGYAYENGITNGTGPSTFSPNKSMTDYMFLTLVLDAFFIMFINMLSVSMVSSTGEAAMAAVNMVGSVNSLLPLNFSKSVCNLSTATC